MVTSGSGSHGEPTFGLGSGPGMDAMGARPVAEGAASIVWEALLGDDGPTGGFFRDGQPLRC